MVIDTKVYINTSDSSIGEKMVRQVAGTSQWRKLIQTKEHSDTYGAVWKLSTMKVAAWLILLLLFLIVVYSFFIPNQSGYLTDVLFYAIIIVAVILIAWFAGNFIWKTRGFFAWFLISWVVIFVFYISMGFALSFVGWKFNYGILAWMIITTFAFIGAGLKNQKSQEISRVDVFYVFLVFLVLVGGNVPAFENGIGFFAKVDDFINIIRTWISNIITE